MSHFVYCRDHQILFWDCPVEDMGFDEEVYVNRRRLQSIVPYAFVKDGEWISKGEMGWFGMSSDDEDQDSWNEKFHEMLASLDPETMLTAVDCHV